MTKILNIVRSTSNFLEPAINGAFRPFFNFQKVLADLFELIRTCHLFGFGGLDFLHPLLRRRLDVY